MGAWLRSSEHRRESLCDPGVARSWAGAALPSQAGAPAAWASATATEAPPREGVTSSTAAQWRSSARMRATCRAQLSRGQLSVTAHEGCHPWEEPEPRPSDGDPEAWGVRGLELRPSADGSRAPARSQALEAGHRWHLRGGCGADREDNPAAPSLPRGPEAGKSASHWAAPLERVEGADLGLPKHVAAAGGTGGRLALLQHGRAVHRHRALGVAGLAAGQG